MNKAHQALAASFLSATMAASPMAQPQSPQNQQGPDLANLEPNRINAIMTNKREMPLTLFWADANGNFTCKNLLPKNFSQGKINPKDIIREVIIIEDAHPNGIDEVKYAQRQRVGQGVLFARADALATGNRAEVRQTALDYCQGILNIDFEKIRRESLERNKPKAPMI